MISALARPLLAAPFITAGLDAALRPTGHAAAAKRVLDLATRMGIPAERLPVNLVTRATGGAMALCGVQLARGRAPHLNALALAALQAPIAIARNPFWQQTGQARQESVKDLIGAAGLVGGAVIAAFDRSRKSSTYHKENGWLSLTVERTGTDD